MRRHTLRKGRKRIMAPIEALFLISLLCMILQILTAIHFCMQSTRLFLFPVALFVSITSVYSLVKKTALGLLPFIVCMAVSLGILLYSVVDFIKLDRSRAILRTYRLGWSAEAGDAISMSRDAAALSMGITMVVIMMQLMVALRCGFYYADHSPRGTETYAGCQCSQDNFSTVAIPYWSTYQPPHARRAVVPLETQSISTFDVEEANNGLSVKYSVPNSNRL